MSRQHASFKPRQHHTRYTQGATAKLDALRSQYEEMGEHHPARDELLGRAAAVAAGVEGGFRVMSRPEGTSRRAAVARWSAKCAIGRRPDESMASPWPVHADLGAEEAATPAEAYLSEAEFVERAA